MKIKFTLREPGNHHEIATREMSAIPRKDERVIINNLTYIVHEVSWDADADEALILVK